MGRIVAFGDSITSGQFGAPYVDELKRFNRKILNYGVNGLTTTSQLDIIKKHIEEEDLSQDVAYILAIGSNDMIGPYVMEYGDQKWKDWYAKEGQTYISSPDKFKLVFEMCLQYLTDIGKPVVVACPPHLQLAKFDVKIEEEFDDAIKEVCKKFDVPCVDTKALQKIAYTEEEYNRTLPCRDKYIVGAILMLLCGIPLNDVIFPGLFKLYLTVDGIHSSKKTAKIEGEAVAAEVDKLL